MSSLSPFYLDTYVASIKDCVDVTISRGIYLKRKISDMWSQKKISLTLFPMLQVLYAQRLEGMKLYFQVDQQKLNLSLNNQIIARLVFRS